MRGMGSVVPSPVEAVHKILYPQCSEAHELQTKVRLEGTYRGMYMGFGGDS